MKNAYYVTYVGKRNKSRCTQMHFAYGLRAGNKNKYLHYEIYYQKAYALSSG